MVSESLLYLIITVVIWYIRYSEGVAGSQFAEVGSEEQQKIMNILWICVVSILNNVIVKASNTQPQQIHLAATGKNVTLYK